MVVEGGCGARVCAERFALNWVGAEKQPCIITTRKIHYFERISLIGFSLNGRLGHLTIS